MKKNLNIFALVVVLVVAQACGSKSEKNIETPVAEKAVEVKESTPTLAEKRAKVEADRAAKAEARRVALEERIKASLTYTDAKGKIVFNKAEVDPSYNGGEKAMMKYLKENIQFPKDAQDKGLEGTVFVDFIVAANGTVREVTVADAPGEEVDQSFRAEAIRVVSTMPNWVPGRQHGKAVDVSFSLPISFQMI
jgi:TonB family protein